MKRRWRTYLALLLIIAMSWIELQYFSEAAGVDNGIRKAAHILFLVGVMAVGYFGWYKHPVIWLKKIWLACYFGCLVLIITVGFVNMKFSLGLAFLDEIHHLRLLFSSPVPFMMTMMAPRIKKMLHHNTGFKPEAEK